MEIPANFEALDSSLISHRHYDRSSEIMHLVFRAKDGGPGAKAYRYGNISGTLYDAGLAFISPSSGEPSFGSWFQRIVKPNKDRYPFTVIELDANQVSRLRGIFAGTPAQQPPLNEQLRASLESIETVDFASGQPIPVAAGESAAADSERVQKARAEYDRLLADPETPRKLLDAAQTELMAAQEESLQAEVQAIHTKLALVGSVSDSAIVISTEEGARLAQITGDAIARMRDALERTMRPEITRLYSPYKAALAILNRYDKPLEHDQVLLRAALASFGREQKRIAAAKQEEARKAQEEESRAAAAAKAQDLQLNDAIEAEQRGEPELAESILAAPALTLAPSMPAPARVAPAIPKEVDKSLREKWQWEMVDAEKLPDEFWIVDTKAIDNMVRDMKGRSNTLLNGAIHAYDAGTAAFSKK